MTYSIEWAPRNGIVILENGEPAKNTDIISRMNNSLSAEAMNNLNEFLEVEEHNIANDIEGYGLLKSVFHEIMGRNAEE